MNRYLDITLRIGAAVAVCAATLGVMAWSRSASCAELVEMDVSLDGKSSISFLLGSAQRSGERARGTFSLKVDGRVFNIVNSISRQTCYAGTGPLFSAELVNPSVPIGSYQWVKGDGSFADTVTEILCATFEPQQKTNPFNFKKTALTF